MPALILAVRFCEGRYHGICADGRPEWPPSPARVFQALLAGAARGSTLNTEYREALKWLEALPCPLIKAPKVSAGQSYRHFMPNNDLDTVGGDPKKLPKIRTSVKRFHPRIFDNRLPLLYAWSFKEPCLHAEHICDMAQMLYQLGRGVDMAWAVADIVADQNALIRTASYTGTIYVPTKASGNLVLACPRQGSLASLIDRYEKAKNRFRPVIEHAPTKNDPKKSRFVNWAFTQPPKPQFRMVHYNCPATTRLYDVRELTTSARFRSFPLEKVARVVETVRNAAAKRLGDAWPEKAGLVDRVYGLCRDAGEADKAFRLRIIPVPSIGHPYADHGIRRILVEIPPDCPLAVEDIAWSFASLGNTDLLAGETPWALVPAQDYGMLSHYGVGDENEAEYRTWRTVTPMALSVNRTSRKRNGPKRASLEQKAAWAVVQSLRHAGLKGTPESIRVQREPFDAKGSMAEQFAPGTRFAPSRLWHVEISFAEPHSGPLVAGDGRYLGLGLMGPVKRMDGVFSFRIIEGLLNAHDAGKIAKALRRAIMALVQTSLGLHVTLPTFFTGHEADGAPARRGRRTHLAFSFDGPRQRLIVISPHVMEAREPTRKEKKHLNLMEQALSNFCELRTGPFGLLKLKPEIVSMDTDPLFRFSRIWVSQNYYRPTRYVKHTTREEAIISDLRVELSRRNLPLPISFDELQIVRGPKGGLSARMKLIFATAIKGPLLLGRDSNFGGGLFAAEPPFRIS